jgi:hypothetical protein
MPRKFALSAVSDAARATFREGPARRVTAVLALILVLVVIGALVQPVRHQLALSFTRKPTRYSELYFTQLPRTRANQLRLGFRIANRGDHDVPYSYTIRIAPGSSPGVVIKRGTTTIAPNHTADIAIQARIRPGKGSRTATVTLAGGGAKEIRVHARLVTGSTS